MNEIKSFKYVADLINSKDDIVEQLQILRKYQYRKGVRKFIDSLIEANLVRHYDDDAKYILYCIVKYYYGLDVKKVKEPIPLLDIITPSNYNEKKIAKLLDSKDNIIEQCKLLKEHKNSLDVRNYIACASTYYGYDALTQGLNTKYQKYCIDKYFFDLDVLEVNSPHVCLYAYTRLKDEVHTYEDISNATSFSKLKKGDKVKILNGSFKGLEATVQSISKDFKEANFLVVLFEQETLLPLDDTNKVRKINDDK